MLPKLSTLSLDRALAAKSVPCGRMKPRRRPLPSKLYDEYLDGTLASELLDLRLLEERRDLSLPRDSLVVASLFEPWEADDEAERHLDSGGQGPIARVGESSGDGES
jgi:hypothetical protein